MHIEQYGKGERTFVAFHGWGGDHREFAPLAARLPEGARLLSVDLPGYGRSPKPPRWEMKAIVGEIVRELDERGLNEITLVGFCSGAVVALLVAQQVPGRVKRIVMIDPFAFVPWYFRIFLAGEFGRRAYRATFASPMGRRITTRILRQRQRTDDDFMGAFGRVDHETTQEWLRLLHLEEPASRFAGLSVPIDIAHGERTFAAVRESVREYLENWPDARVFQLHNVGHLPLVRGAGQLAAIVFGGGDREEASRHSG
ncbi:MAG: alpha/beta fold hydrolase [Kiritimatiellae bacterium]|nr:alpha/beta fold hydrolase [Kiritimatiellia bacterium]